MTPRTICLTVLVALAFPTAAPAQAKKPKPRTLFKNVKVFDGKTPRLTPGHVLVVGNKIAAVGKTLPAGAAKGARVIDGAGRTLMPGLIDGHVHLCINAGFAKLEDDLTVGEMHLRSGISAKNALMDGFTTVRDMGGPVFGLKRTIDQGQLVGPRIYGSGSMISQTSGHGDFRSRADPNPTLTGQTPSNWMRFGLCTVADGTEKVLAAARQNLMQGASQIKIMAGGGGSSRFDPIDTTQYTVAEIKAAVDAASDWGTYVGAHIFTSKAIRRCVGLGVKTLEHAFFMDEATVEFVAKKGAYVVPQCWGFSPEITNNPNIPEEKKPMIKKLIGAPQKNLGNWLLKHKVKVVFQSDLCGDLEESVKWRRYELHWRTKVFKSNFEVLKQATSVAGEMLQLSGKRNPYPGKLGVIEQGALADILLVDGNPLEDIKVLGANTSVFGKDAHAKPIKTIRLIMKDGKLYKNTLN